MPAHIYSRVGRWHDAVLANQKAIAADTAYLEMCRGSVQGNYPLGYVPHNPHFLWFAASMEGASEVAREAAVQTAARVDNPELMRQPGYAAQQHYWMTPWFDRVRFGGGTRSSNCPIPLPTCPTSRRSGTTRKGWPPFARGVSTTRKRIWRDWARPQRIP